MNEELLKKKYFAEGNYMLICPGVTKAFGGMLISPFYDSILENAWIELNNYDRYNFLAVKIQEYTIPISEFRNFSEDSLENFLEKFEFLEKIEEDTVEYFEFYKKIKIYSEIREHCYKVLGKGYFE